MAQNPDYDYRILCSVQFLVPNNYRGEQKNLLPH